MASFFEGFKHLIHKSQQLGLTGSASVKVMLLQTKGRVFFHISHDGADYHGSRSLQDILVREMGQ